MSSYTFSSEVSGEYSVAYSALTVAGLISIIVSCNCVRVVQCVGEMAHGSNREVDRNSHLIAIELFEPITEYIFKMNDGKFHVKKLRWSLYPISAKLMTKHDQ